MTELERAFGKTNARDHQTDLERYRQLAFKLGASGAVVIPADSVSVDERVRLKCTIPRCARAGETPNCPPYAPDLDLVRKAITRYSLAILIKCDVPLDPHLSEDVKTEVIQKQRMLFHQKGAEVVSGIERQAFSDGYHLAMGLAGGSCKDYLCLGQPCQYFETGACRHPLESRPSIEALGIDITALINNAGWSTYALNSPERISAAITVGLVFIS